MRKLTLYAVVEKEKYLEHTERFLTLTTKRSESTEYIERLIRAECNEHFVAWCNLREIKPTDISWERYKENIGDKFDRFIILKVKFDAKGIAAIFRMFNGCIPIGTSYDNPMEYMNIINKLPQELKEKLEKATRK